MLRFPDAFPVDALQVLGPVVRSGGTISDATAVGEAALTLLGYGLGLWLGTEHVSPAATFGGPAAPTMPLSDEVDSSEAEEALDNLEQAAVPGKAKVGTAAATPAAGQLAGWAIELAMFVLSRLQSRDVP